MVDKPRSTLLTRLEMFRILVAIIMLISTGAAVTHSCSHDVVSHNKIVSMATDSGHQNAPKQDESNHEQCCQFHCHQLVSLAPFSSASFSTFEPREIAAPIYKVLYTDPSLALLTRPPLAA